MPAQATASSAASDDGVLPVTRVVAIVILPFLVIAAILLFAFPERTGELFAWAIAASAVRLHARFAHTSAESGSSSQVARARALASGSRPASLP